MAINILHVDFALPPGRLSSSLVGELLDLLLRRFQWFEPRRYGTSLAERIDPNHFKLAPILTYYEEHSCLFVAARTNRDFIYLHPFDTGDFPYIGTLSWTTSATSASKPSWRAALSKQVVEVMRLVQSPLALAGMQTDLKAKQWRLIPKSKSHEGRVFTYSEEVFTVRDYSQGLAGLFWRNFYGPPFVRMFGERLDALPPECRHSFGEDIVLVQPYELPKEAGSEAAIARERQLISLLGPEHFYDHSHHTLPSRVPVLDSLGQPLH